MVYLRFNQKISKLVAYKETLSALSVLGDFQRAQSFKKGKHMHTTCTYIKANVSLSTHNPLKGVLIAFL